MANLKSGSSIGGALALFDGVINPTFNGNVYVGNATGTPTPVLNLYGSTAGAVSTIKTTNGNLHIDCYTGANATYLNYYTGTGGVIFGNGAGGPSGASVSAAGVFTGALSGNVTGNVSGSSGSCTGNAASATTAGACTGDAASVDGQSFAWSNSSNSPTYLWAADSNGSAYLAARASISVASAGTATSATSATTATNLGSYYTADSWLRTIGDAYQHKVYGNSRTVINRTDGVTNDDGGGGYAFIWKYGGSADANRVMILGSDGRIYSPYHGWLDTMNITGSSASCTGNAGGSSASCTGNSATVTHNASRTDTAWYNVGWFSGASSPSYSCNAVQIYSSNGYLTATILGANSTGTSYQLNVGGTIGATGDITGNTSDKRLKTNIVPIVNALDKVDKLNGFTYNPNKLAEEIAGLKMSDKCVGVFAQELQEVLPEAVKPAPFDNDPSIGSISGEFYLTVQYEKIVPLLIEAIKELRAEVNELKKNRV